MGYLGIVKIDGTSHKVGSTLFGTCATEAATAAKVVACSDFTELPTGVTIHVKFTYSNTAANPTLNINSKGAKAIYRYGTTVPGTTTETSWNAGAVISFTYDGSNFMMNDWVNTNTNTDTNVTQTATNTNANYEVLFSGTADNTTRTEGARKYSNLTFNPSTGTLTTTKIVSANATLGVADIDTANITEDNVGNLIVTGAARFLNTINGSISGNAATASDSAKLNGYASDTSATNNTIARRTANGYIFATYFNQSSGAETPTSSSYIIYANSDGYFRKSTVANMKTAMSLNNVENKSSATIRGELTSANVTTALGYTPVNKAGDTMSGTLTFSTTNAINYSGSKANYSMIRFINNTSDTYGNGISIGGGGQTVIGGGESATVMQENAGTSGEEIMYIGNDQNVQIFTGLQNGWDSRKTFTFDTSGALTATKFIGALQGNADTATSATTASKLGTTTVGSTRQPIYLSNGTPTTANPTVYHWGNAGKSNMNDVGRNHASTGMTNLTDPSNTTDNPMNGTTKSTGWHLYWSTNYYDDPNGSNAWVSQICNLAGTNKWWVRSRNGGTITNGTAWAASWEHLTISPQAGQGSSTNPIYVDENGHTQSCTYSLNKSVPSNAVFTDTTYSAGTGLTLSGTQFSVSTANASTIMNLLTTGSSAPTDNDYYIAQYAGGGTSTTTYHRRPHSALWSYIKGKTDVTYLPLAGGTMTGQIVLARTGYKTNSTSGYSVDQYGNFKHQSTSTGEYWVISNNAGTAKFSVYWETGKVVAAGDVQSATTLCANTANSSTAGGLSLYGTDPTTYGVLFRGTGNQGKHGYVQSDWATYFTMSNTNNRGWVFRRNGSGNVASIDTNGQMVLNGSLTIGGNEANTSGVRQVYNATTQSLDFIFL